MKGWDYDKNIFFCDYSDSGVCFVIDFTQRQDAEENNIKKTANYMKKLLSHHFAAELAATQQFRGIYVFPKVNEMDGSKVIRCAISYKRLSSVGAFKDFVICSL